MIIVEKIVGNIYADRSLYERSQILEKEKKLEKLSLSISDARKSRIRKNTDRGTEIGIIQNRKGVLSSGDVLVLTDQNMVLVEIEMEEAMVIDFGDHLDSSALLERAVRLGHLIGNQHWAFFVKGNCVYVPITIDRRVMDTVIKGGNIPGIAFRYQEIDPSSFKGQSAGHHHPQSRESRHSHSDDS